VTAAQLKKLREVSQLFYELANIHPNKRQAYVGDSAFAHKGGLHVSGVLKNRETYEHIDPDLVGNRQRVLVSDLSGRSNVVYKGKEYGINLNDKGDAVKDILRRTKELESQGFEVLYSRYITAPMDVLKDGKLKNFVVSNFFETDTTDVPFKATSIFMVARKN
jgi:2-isopropylmalate synthase